MAKSTLGTGNGAMHELNHMAPAAWHVKLGTMLENIINNQNAMITNQASILAKLDAIGAASTAGGIATAAGTTNVSGATATTALTPPSQI